MTQEKEKKTVRLNNTLIASLGSIMRVTDAEICKAAGFSITTWYRLKDHPEKMSIQYLLGIANDLQIPIRHFFTTEKTDKVMTREEYLTSTYGIVLQNLISKLALIIAKLGVDVGELSTVIQTIETGICANPDPSQDNNQ